MNKVILNKTIIENNKITYYYDILGEWKSFFRNRKKYSIQYNINLDNLPVSIANIQFVLNFLPMVWLFNATLYIEELDNIFFDSISNFKDGYINMYPQLNFDGEIVVNHICDNKYEPNESVAVFFSGGLDATSTLASHYSERPILINIQGSDISLKFSKVLDDLKKFLKNIANEYNLDITFIKSEFRMVIKEKKVTKFYYNIIHDNYWHAFQHGIAIIGHAAPIAYLNKLKTVYIASSFTKKDHAKCASDPTIDSCVKLCSTGVYHDGYEFDRQDKSENVYRFLEEENKNIKLRVCLDDYRKENCCHCEKCYRTILGFASKGYDPKAVGFNITENDYKRIELDIKNKIIIEFTSLWKNIQNEFLKHPDLEKDERFSWIYKVDFDTINNKKIKKIRKFIDKYIRRIKKLYILVENWSYKWRKK